MKQSNNLFEQAQKHIPGGVNSPVRAFKGVGGTPVFIEKAQGAYIYDTNNQRYIDYVGSWGPMILGHAHPEVIIAVKNAVDKGLSFGAPTILETKMANKVCELVPSMDMVRMVSSGTEATMSAVRLARGYTSRDKIVKFEGCYHGHSDSFLIKAGSGMLTLGEPTSPGVPSSLAEHTLTLEYNNTDSLQRLFAELGNEIAAVIIEPVAGNMGCIPPAIGFLENLRKLCTDNNVVLIFDEVMTGFRVALGGAQALYNVQPDMTTLGKIIGGGMPIGAFGGKKEIMQQLAPLGPVYQAGTLSGNPIAMAAGLKTLEKISQTGFYEQLIARTTELLIGLQAAAESANIPFTSNQVGAMFSLFFTDNKNIKNLTQVSASNIQRFNQFFHAMQVEGIYLAPSAYEAGFISSAHSKKDIQDTIDAATHVFSHWTN